MAINVKGSGRGKRGELPALSEMNVIPLVDVVLVLLIIFMLTASVMEFGIKVDVPKTKQVSTSAQNLPVLEMSRAGELYLSGRPVRLENLKGQIQERFPKAESVYLRADGGLTWNVMAQVVAELKSAGISINLVTKPIERK